MAEITDKGKDFLVSEHVQLRNEIMYIIKEINLVERYAIIISIAIWAWLSTHSWKPNYYIIIWIPALVVLLLRKKRKALSNATKNIAIYIKKVESAFNLIDKSGNQLGWEHRDKISTFKSWSTTYWNLIFIINIVLAIFFILTELCPNYWPIKV